MLSKKILSYKTKALVKKSKVARNSVSYEQAKSIGIVFTIDDLAKHETIKQLVRRLEKDGKKVQALAFLPKGKENFEFLFDFFTDKDVTMWGNFTADQVHSFVEKPFDYLFYLDQKSNPLITNILAMSKAKCRIGKFNEVNNQLCELMIQTQNGSSIQHLAEEMYKYTKILS
ncbi:hypothetical protein GCM10009122_37510 [Fulvivirga kasyanovii]|uniref:Uncharacterized protein n=1 Tax=Fulvivirga kasyanovii TaxID=396812 RepID=A0ABW9RL73_9BACT|nr:hypothetical protein [Fulvivirga kasyanovii]MTI24848.1 hypothetical protein [Fulvivirga kasyanovii]